MTMIINMQKNCFISSCFLFFLFVILLDWDVVLNTDDLNAFSWQMFHIFLGFDKFKRTPVHFFEANINFVHYAATLYYL
jgi:hypothetical protein